MCSWNYLNDIASHPRRIGRGFIETVLLNSARPVSTASSNFGAQNKSSDWVHSNVNGPDVESIGRAEYTLRLDNLKGPSCLARNWDKRNDRNDIPKSIRKNVRQRHSSFSQRMHVFSNETQNHSRSGSTSQSTRKHCYWNLCAPLFAREWWVEVF